MENMFAMVAKTFQGLEEVLRDELISLGAHNVEMGRRMVSFEGDLAMMYKANLCCRTALRILKPIEKFSASTPDELYDIVREIPWEKYMSEKTTFSIDSTVNSEDFPHSRFVTYRVKDGIVDHFRDLSGTRPAVCVSGADIVLNVHIQDSRVTISLDSSGESLSKRGYRVAQTAAPINEVLAAGIIMMTGWRGDCDFADPMCGSGTFLIEAALIAANINPGIYRKHFAFEKWTDFDADLFEELYNDDSNEREFNYKIYGGDIDPEAVAIANRNIREAKVEDMVEISCRPFTDWTDNPESGVLVTNPPYGARLRPDDMTDLYKSIGSTLKKYFPGWHAWIIGLSDEDFANIGLKPSLKIPLLNGSLECTLREYVLFDGSYSDFRADGRSISHHNDENSHSRGPKRMKHISEDEWNAEVRRFGSSKERKGTRKETGDFSKKSYKKDSDKKYGKDARGFKKDSGFHKDKRGSEYGKPASGSKGFRKDTRKDSRKDVKRDGITINPKGPRISADNAYVISEVPIRSRRKKTTDMDDNEA